MRTMLIMTGLLVAASAVGAAPNRQPAKGTTPKPAAQQMKCPMCGQMMPAGQQMPGMQGMQGMQGGMMNPQMMGHMMQMMGPATMTVAEDGKIYILRGGSLYQYSPDLKLLGTAQLPPPAMGMPGGAAATGAGGQDHKEHHPK